MYRNILVPIDLDEPGSWAGPLATAQSIAKCFSARVTLCTVVSDVQAIERGEWLPISVEQLLFDARARLEGIAASIDEPECGIEIAAGTIAGGVLEVAQRIGADLIVSASHQPGKRDHVIAANAIRIARRASCSVLIARHRAP